jgi:hypothetical protein
MAQAKVTYSGTASTVYSAEGELARGVRPSAFLLHLGEGQHTVGNGDLVFTDDGTGKTVTLKNCTCDAAFFKEPHFSTRKELRWDVARLLDRRAHWRGIAGNGEYNVRTPDGLIVDDGINKQSMKALAELLLDRLGETVTATGVSEDFYPYLKFNGSVVDALESLLYRFGYDLVLKLDDSIEIVAAGGTGDNTTLAGYMDPADGVTAEDPENLKLVCGTTIWQSHFLLEGVALEEDASVVLQGSASYIPTEGWQWPQFFAYVADTYRWLAFTSVYRWYRAKELAEGGYTPAGATEAGTSVTQMLPWFVSRMGTGDHITGRRHIGDIEIKATWWPYTDHPVNTSPCQDFQDGFDIDADAGIIKFHEPIFKLSGGCPVEADVYALVAHRFRKADGEFDRKEYTLSGGGSSEDMEIVVPELFLAVRQSYAAGACSTVAATTDNETALAAEANAVLAAWKVAITDQHPIRERRAIGILDTDCSGRVSSVYWEAGRGSIGTTRIRYGVNESPLRKLLKYQPQESGIRERNG